MAWVAVAVGVVGAGASAYSSHEASKAQDEANQAAAAASAAQLEFEKQQYQDWRDVYGSVEQNLSEFYNNYDAEHVTALGLHNVEKEYTVAKNNLVQELSRRGLDTSGLMASSLTQLETAKAYNKASIRAEAPLKASEAKSQFLGVGKGLESSLQQGISNAYTNQANLYTQSALQAGSQAQAASSGLASSIGAIGTSIAAGMERDAYEAPTGADPYSALNLF